MPLVLHLMRLMSSTAPPDRLACWPVASLPVASSLDELWRWPVEAMQGSPQGRGRDPNGNGPFDCYGVLAPDPAWCSSIFFFLEGGGQKLEMPSGPKWRKCQNSPKDREARSKQCSSESCDWLTKMFECGWVEFKNMLLQISAPLFRAWCSCNTPKWRQSQLGQVSVCCWTH